MNSFLVTSANIALKAITLAGKFLLVIYLAKRLTPEQLGLFGIFSVSVNYALYIIGLDYYTYANREMIGCYKEEWPIIIRDQAIFYILIYFFAIPIISLIFFYDFLNWKYYKWFLLILALEHMAQEMNRVLIAIQQPVKASIVHFMRSGLWSYAIILIMINKPPYRSLSTVFVGWSIGLALGLIIALGMVSNLKWGQAFSKPPNWKWIYNGVGKSLPLLMGTIALRGIYTLDRFFLKIHWGEASVGVYTFFLTITNSLQYLIDASVLIIYFPKLTSSFKNGYIEKFQNYHNKMSHLIYLFSLFFVISISLLIWPILLFINKPAYNEHLLVFGILLVSNVLVAISGTPHLTLYAMGKDRITLRSNLFSFCVALICFLVLIPYGGEEGAAFSLLISSAFMLYYKKIKHNKIMLDLERRRRLLPNTNPICEKV